VPAPQSFFPGSVAAGEWWRLLTHPFVHVSWYHLLLDGGAFFLILGGLRERGAWRRLSLVAASALGSLAAVLVGAPGVTSLGFCGLSGAAHGLMAASALEMIRAADGSERRLGAALLAGTAAKCLYEALTGRCFLEILHFGLLGTPLAISHAGGFLGGALVWLALDRCPREHLPHTAAAARQQG
jgi:rhomboid family GlyGly-CTERM serine protease